MREKDIYGALSHYAHAMGLTGDWDLVCCGHDHRVEIASVKNIKGGETLIINPGTVGGVGAKPTYVFGDLDSMEFEVHLVPVPDELAYNKTPVTPHQ